MKIFSIIAFFLSWSCSILAQPNKPSSEIEKLVKFVGVFVEHVRLNNVNGILDIADIDKRERAHIERFLGGVSLFPGQIDPINKLISQAESIAVLPVNYSNSEYKKFGSGFTVFFVKKDVSLTAVLNKKKRWLVDYAACDFFIKGAKVSYGMTFCYSGTEGPFFYSD